MALPDASNLESSGNKNHAVSGSCQVVSAPAPCRQKGERRGVSAASISDWRRWTTSRSRVLHLRRRQRARWRRPARACGRWLRGMWVVAESGGGGGFWRWLGRRGLEMARSSGGSVLLLFQRNYPNSYRMGLLGLSYYPSFMSSMNCRKVL
jgi:hypothetical protein